jgi:16S rRNA (uracil1498-N3)-methyltransferase
MDPAVPRVVLDRARLAPHTEVELARDETRYLRAVLRLADGDAVLVLDGAGHVFEASVGGAGLRIGAAGDAERAALAETAPCRVEILQALPKGDRFADVVRQATELGVWRLVPTYTARTVRRPGGGTKAERWRRIAREAARQSRRLWVPEVDAPRPVEEAFAAARGALKILLHEGERTRRLRDLVAAPPADRSVSIAVGPEGGFSAGEVAAAEAHGFAPATLGPRVLRTETVALAACAVLQHLWGDLG